jgi:aminoglycoside phosphotransferase (APT) family kinase protein
VHRSRAEYHWLQVANTIAPGHVPKPYGWSAAQNGIAMEFVAGPDVTLWKRSLLSGAPEQGQAAAVGSILGRIHAASARPGFDRAPFANRDDFRALRIEPYLTFTATRHPDLAPQLIASADTLYAADAALVHGDVSPKNILFRGSAPILLDAECATMGDPAFDVAFCLNHLILKAVHLPQSAQDRLRGARELWQAYVPHVAWEAPATLEVRVAALVPALMLARVDGKSPVEYLSDSARDHVRTLSRNILQRAPSTLGDFFARLSL